jgi:hypothetical protein
MTDAVTISQAVVQWAELAGCEAWQGAQADDGRAVLSWNLGEMRYIIGNTQDGWLTVNQSDRLGPEDLVLSSPTIDVVDKYLLAKLGSTIRERRDLPRLKFPTSSDGIYDGYRIQQKEFDGTPRYTLFDAVGSIVAFSGFGQLVANLELVRLSYHLESTLDEIKISYLEENGSPLFNFDKSE